MNVFAAFVVSSSFSPKLLERESYLQEKALGSYSVYGRNKRAELEKRITRKPVFMEIHKYINTHLRDLLEGDKIESQRKFLSLIVFCLWNRLTNFVGFSIEACNNYCIQNLILIHVNITWPKYISM